MGIPLVAEGSYGIAALSRKVALRFVSDVSMVATESMAAAADDGLSFVGVDGVAEGVVSLGVGAG